MSFQLNILHANFGQWVQARQQRWTSGIPNQYFSHMAEINTPFVFPFIPAATDPLWTNLNFDSTHSPGWMDDDDDRCNENRIPKRPLRYHLFSFQQTINNDVKGHLKWTWHKRDGDTSLICELCHQRISWQHALHKRKITPSHPHRSLYSSPSLLSDFH